MVWLEECADLLSLLLCLFGSHEIHQSFMTELEDNALTRRLWFLELYLCARRLEIHQVRKWREKQDNEMVSSYLILSPHPKLISLHGVYHREILGRGRNTKVGTWFYKIKSTLREMDLSSILSSKLSKILHAWPCAECVTSTLILHDPVQYVLAPLPL